MILCQKCLFPFFKAVREILAAFPIFKRKDGDEKVAGLQKKGPKKRKGKKSSFNKGQKLENKLPTLDELKEEDEEFDEFKRMMEDSPSYKRHHGALRSVK